MTSKMTTDINNHLDIKSNELDNMTLNLNQGDQTHNITHNYYNSISKKGLNNRPIQFNLSDPILSFRGRDEELCRLLSVIRNHKIAVVTGMGGIGKSELARNYAAKHKSMYQNIVWINGEDEDNLIKSFHALAGELSVDIKKNDTQRYINLILQDIYNLFKETRTLIIFDNVLDESSVNQFLPSRVYNTDNEICVLITSQYTTWTETDKTINLTPLSESGSLDLFKAVLGENVISDTNKNQWINLAHALDFLPLSLQLSSAYIKQEMGVLNIQFSIEEYIERLNSTEHLLLDNVLPEYGNKTLIASFEMTLDKIKTRNTYSVLAINLLNICAYLNSDYINEEILMICLSLSINRIEELRRALIHLSNFSLITVVNNKIRIHRLVQKLLRQKMIRNKCKQYLEGLLNHVIDDNKYNMFYHRRTILQHAREEIKAVMKLYKNNNSSQVLRILAQNGCHIHLKAIFKTMLPWTVKWKVRKNFLVYEAACSGDLPTVKLMYQYNKSVNKRNKFEGTPLQVAMDMGFNEIRDFLIEHGASLDRTSSDIDGITQLHRAAIDGHVEMTQFLIDRMDINIQSNSGYTALHYAVQHERVQVVNLLLRMNANTDIQSVTGRTPLHLAVKCKDQYIIEKIIAKGANLVIQDNKGLTPLHLAIKYNYILNALILIRDMTDLNVQDENGDTPLQLALKLGRLSIASVITRGGPSLLFKLKLQ